MSTNVQAATKSANRIDPNKEPSIEIRGKQPSPGKRLVKKVKKATSPFIRTDYIRRQYLKTKNKFKRDSTKKNENRQNEVKTDKSSHLNNSDDEYDEFPIRAIKFDEIENVKTNILKFQTNKTITVEKDFHMPVRLHRKDTRNLQFQLTRAEIVQRQKEIIEYKKKLMDEEKKESRIVAENAGDENAQNIPENKTMIQKMLETQTGSDVEQNTDAVDEEQSASLRPSEAGKVIYDGKEGFINSELTMGDEDNANMDMFADVAPDGGARVKKGGWFGKRKTRQLKKFDEHAKKLRFEEFYPWVLEDFDGYNTWVGTYEAGNSDHYVMFSVEKDGSFTMLPCDKVYRFTARSQFATLTIEEAEKRFEKKRQSVPRWLMKHLDDIGTTTTRYERTVRKLKGVDGNTNQQDDDDSAFRKDNSDNEIDYDDEFQDDEEAPIVDGNDQENKETEQRMKKEMLQANAMGLRDDQEHIISEEEEDEQKSEDKTIKNALKKTDMGVLYDSDDEDEDDPYLSKSDLELEENKDQDVKPEEKSDADKLSSPDKKGKKVKKPKTSLKHHKNNLIVIKSSPEILKRFPLGEWYPKTNGNQKLSVSVHESKSDLSSAISKSSTPDTKLAPVLTKDDIVEIISQNPGKLTLKDLIKQLKLKVVMNAENKNTMKILIKQIVKLNNGFLDLVQNE
ncbi:hypothetical protein QEN19_002616 [Hanseniaspora menglaensis]